VSRSRALTLGLAAALLVVAAPGVAYPCDPSPCAQIDVISAAGTQGPAPFTVELSCASSLPSTITFCDWDFGEGMPDKITGVGTVQHEYLAPGGYTVVLGITDNGTDYHWTSLFISVATTGGVYPPVIETATVDNPVGPAPWAVTFTATVTAGSGSDQWQEFWRLGVGDPITGHQRQFTYINAGRYRTRFEAISSTGLVSISQPIDVDVQDGTSDGPLVRATAQTTDAIPKPPVGPPPLRIKLLASPLNLPGYAWELGDGRTAAGSEATVSYALPGTYWARLTGTDPAGRKGYDEVRIVVTEGEWAAAVVSVPPARACVGEPYAYAAEARGTPTVTFSLPTAPSGMTIDAGGSVSWTPTVAQVGSNAVTLQAENATGKDLQQFSIEVSCCTDGVCPVAKESSGCAYAGPGAGAAGLLALLLAVALVRARRLR
jgi:PKD repeat protein